MPTKKIYTNTLAQIAGKIATAIIAIFMIKILAVYLGLDGRGIYDKLFNYLSIFSVIADLGLYTISVRELSKHQENPEKMERISGNILSLRTISGLIIIVLSLLLALFLPGYNTPTVLSGVFIVSIFTLFGLINSSIMSYLQATLKTEFSFIANTSGKLLTFGMILSCVYIFFPASTTPLETRLVWALLSTLAGNILMTAMTTWYASRFQKIRFYWDSDYISHILKLSIPYGVALFLGAIFLKVDIFLLSIMENPVEADKLTALYSLPMKIVEVGMMYGTIFLNSLLPVLTTAIEQKKDSETKKLSARGFELLMGFGAGISVFLAFFAERIIPFLGSAEFLEPMRGANSADVMRVVSWVFLFYFVSSLANYILIASNEQKKIIYVNLSIAIFNLVGNLLVIPHYSFMGSAYVTLVSQMIMVGLCFYLVRHKINKKQIFIFAASLLSASLIAGAIAYEASVFANISSLFLSLALSGVVFGGLYLGMWFVLRKFVWKS